jgi:hypothetical protein
MCGTLGTGMPLIYQFTKIIKKDGFDIIKLKNLRYE